VTEILLCLVPFQLQVALEGEDGGGEAKRRRRSERGEKGELIRRRSASHLRTF